MTTNYEVTGRVCRISTGVLELSKEQAAARLHNLKPVKGKRPLYEVVGPVEFKVGEKIGYEGDLPKSMAEILVSADKKAANKNAADKEEPSEEDGSQETQE